MGLIMKKTYLIAFLSLSLFLTGCIDQKVTTSSAGGGGDVTTQTNGDNGGGTTGSTGNTGTTGTNGSTGTGTGTTCYGTQSDGSGTGTPIHHLNLFLAGYQDWYPQYNGDSLAQQTFITPQEASILFSSDSRLRVRFMVKPQPQPPSNQTYCYGRNTGVQIQHYGKLKFEIHLRDIQCSNGSTTSCPSGQYVLGPRYGGPIYVGPIDVDSCSPVIDLGHLRNQSNFGTTVEVAAVKSDQYCQINGTFCESEKNVRSIDCWQMTMQVVTDSTQDFN
jgi:hypothetical protein